MKKLGLLLLAVMVVVLMLLTLRHMNTAQDERLCVIMETQTEFDGETVDTLWHWKTEGRPSARFNRLYADKIKDLPGWRP